MSVKIRLRRTGRKKQPSYRLIVADSTTPRNGQYLDSLGTYNPLTKPADLRIDLEKVDQWLAQGAEMSDTAASLIRKARQGGDRKVAVRPTGPEVREATPDVTAAAEPPRTRARAGSRGAGRTGGAAVAEAPVAEQTVAESAVVEPSAEEPPVVEPPVEAAAEGAPEGAAKTTE